ncbi:putative cyclin-B3-1 isoform X2 [Diospyros lotus]|uniref:putative cyclin-B3-1 isoform X2 n=1 Tax=Diospyros lotus TaxID=55363 RepID=UPI00224F6168|nr:putative cyclin-B3-1 isoform X2 [Diospyros lotus]XP_052208658.1 putative cyclin-B3-1 isoform X2 [Diospyros lotus]
MVAPKVKSNTFSKRAEYHGASKCAGKNFKVYVESDKVNVPGRDSINAQSKRKSTSFIKGTTQTRAGYSKEDPKILEKSIKDKRDSSRKTNAGRKVLADVSNLRGNFSRAEVQDGSKPLVSMDSGMRYAMSSSNNCIMGKARENLRQPIAIYSTLKDDALDLKAYVDDQGSKCKGHGSMNTNVRITARNHLPPPRKSLTATKLVKQVNTNDKKGTAENLEKVNGIYGFPVKPKVARKVIPQVTNARNHIWQNRDSDGFIIMASKSQTIVDSKAVARKSVKPIAKTSQRVSGVRTTLKSKGTSGGNKFSATTMSCKKKNGRAIFLSENSASLSTNGQPAKRGVPSESDCCSNIGTYVSVKLDTGKSDRRKSFTSLLIARSKLLEGNGGIMKKENLPSIYDDFNHLEVTEYVDEIYQYYWVLEAQHHSLVNYMVIQTEITPQMRGILINWLIEVHLKFDLMQETLYLSVSLLDQFLSLVTIKKNEMQLVGLTALLLASKYEDFWHPRVLDLLSISAESYTRDQMLGMEKSFLKKLKFRLNIPTPYVFMLRFLRAAQSDTKVEHLAFYLLELCLVEHEALRFKPSLLSASTIYIARCTLGKSPAWTPLLRNHAHYEEYQIRDCAEMVLKFHRAAKTSMLKVTFEKYSGVEYSGVATIKPLNKLPQS